MIEFNGLLTGAAEKYFVNRGIIRMQIAFLCSALLVYPVMIKYAIHIQLWIIPQICLASVVPMIFLPYLCKIDKKKTLPKRMRIYDDVMVSTSERASDCQNLNDVKEVRDYGEFYSILFPQGKSVMFVCQKDLLTQGTLEEFEALFEGKIVRKNKRNSKKREQRLSK